ncbi:MAG: chorismate synthase [Alistipes sp.]|nr:chorismate synthase [Alistipes sp.]MBO7263960.1 chorismate synthase [Alistipes sp.]
MSNSFGNIFRITIFGSSHAESVGITIEGAPKGIALSADMFTADLDRRRPTLSGETARKEEDIPVIEGLDPEGKTTGEAITITFRNADKRSGDYSHLRIHPRPSHADLVQLRKYGNDADIAGGGMASGRMTVALVAAGVVAKRILANVTFATQLVSVNGVTDSSKFNDIIDSVAREGDSVGGVVECRVKNIKPTLGEPFFDSAESVISHLLFSIPGVKGVEFGDGFAGTAKRGSERNDTIIDATGTTLTNNEGGINGGITNGNEIVLRVAIKPTPSIAKKQTTYDFACDATTPLTIGGRHDACIARRAVVAVEAMVAVALADLLLRA